MWLMVIALVLIVTPLVFGRLLARARVEQTNPVPVRRPSLAAPWAVHRAAALKNARGRRLEAAKVHLN